MEIDEEHLKKENLEKLPGMEWIYMENNSRHNHPKCVYLRA
jgi:hypothetical protein